MSIHECSCGRTFIWGHVQFDHSAPLGRVYNKCAERKGEAMEAKYCVDCKFEVDHKTLIALEVEGVKNPTKSVLHCTHPELLNYVTKKPNECDFLRTTRLCTGQYFIPKSNDQLPIYPHEREYQDLEEYLAVHREDIIREINDFGCLKRLYRKLLGAE